MVAVAPSAAPTLDDAMAAAGAMIATGVEEVLLFGSVASGTAGPHSDIDLVAVFADLDYAERHVRRQELEAAARGVVSWPVQVHVTDRPELQARIDRVPTSFECRIAAEAILVLASPSDRPTDWGKEMALPMSDAQESLRHFRTRVLPWLEDLDAATRQGPDEAAPDVPDDQRRRARLNRVVRLCTAAALTAETSLKALAVLYGDPTPTEKELRRNGHTIERIFERHVPDPVKSEVQAVFDRHGVGVSELSAWRQQSTYPDDYDVLVADADRLAATYAGMAPEIAGLLAARLRQEVGSDPDLAAAATTRDRLAARVGSQDVRLGLPAGGGIGI